MAVLFPLRLSCSLSSIILNQINYPKKQHEIIGSWVGIFKQSGLAAQIQTRSDEGIEIL